MSLRIDTQGRIEAVRFQNQTGSPAAPAAGYSLLYLTTNGLYMETSGGAVIGPFVTGTAPAGGRTLIAESTPTGTTATFAAIPGTYKKLTIEYVARSTEAANFSYMKLNFNSDTTATNYRFAVVHAYGVNSVAGEGGDNPYIAIVAANSSPANSCGSGIIEIPFYAQTTFNKRAISRFGMRYDASSLHEMSRAQTLEWENAAAITQIDIVLGAGNFVAGSTLRLYGEL